MIAELGSRLDPQAYGFIADSDAAILLHVRCDNSGHMKSILCYATTLACQTDRVQPIVLLEQCLDRDGKAVFIMQFMTEK